MFELLIIKYFKVEMNGSTNRYQTDRQIINIKTIKLFLFLLVVEVFNGNTNRYQIDRQILKHDNKTYRFCFFAVAWKLNAEFFFFANDNVWQQTYYLFWKTGKRNCAIRKSNWQKKLLSLERRRNKKVNYQKQKDKINFEQALQHFIQTRNEHVTFERKKKI